MSSAMDLTREQLEQIGSYVRENLGTWIRIVDPPIVARMEPEYLERMVRLEEELKSQRELMLQGFAAMDKRFEQVDKRFDETRADMNARFEQMIAGTNARFDQVDRRFAEMRADSNARFEEMRADSNARFEQMIAETNARFGQMDRRFEEARSETGTHFEQMERQFEESRTDVRSRFSDSRHHTNVWMTVLTIVIAVTSVAGPVLAALVTG